MSNQDIDVNLIIQSFQEKLNQLTTENIVKDATIKQLNMVIEELQNVKVKKEEKDK
jgi:hypothetical protein